MDAKRIREIREAEGLTQEDFAEKICIDKQTVSLWERAKNQPNYKALYKICQVFNCSPAFIMGLSKIPYIIKELESIKFDIKTTHFILINDNITISKRKKYLYLKLDSYFLKRLEIQKLLSVYDEEKLNEEFSLIEQAVQKYRSNDGYLEIPLLTYMTDWEQEY